MCDAWLTALTDGASTYAQTTADLPVVASSVVRFAGHAAKCLEATTTVLDGFNPDGYDDVCSTA